MNPSLLKKLRSLVPILLLAILLGLRLFAGGSDSSAGEKPEAAVPAGSPSSAYGLALSSNSEGGKNTGTSSGAKAGQTSETSDSAGIVNEETLPKDGSYDSKEDVTAYLLLYGRLPDNYVTKNEARDAGWSGGSLERVLPGCCIGGDRFGNYEGQLPKAKGRTWTECDIDTMGRNSRGAKRLVFSNDGLIYYTDDHYNHFELVYEP